ncbi:YdiK family protein [Metabacillus sp. GX 13764]|uniref:YdiK family protein n=1 Tax=Metabacillus kandeliae TaxID=2900151 RepID=UPI001E590590|nr:YdiK family protein [Metabacillus kandeliae]MCD7036421.1 YdiK family protein [Metabacillus kandeliae]
MKISPNIMGFFYLGMGVLFTYLAVASAGGGIWKFPTIALIIIATFDYTACIRMFVFANKVRKMKNRK